MTYCLDWILKQVQDDGNEETTPISDLRLHGQNDNKIKR